MKYNMMKVFEDEQKAREFAAKISGSSFEEWSDIDGNVIKWAVLWNEGDEVREAKPECKIKERTIEVARESLKEVSVALLDMELDGEYFDRLSAARKLKNFIDLVEKSVFTEKSI